MPLDAAVAVLDVSPRVVLGVPFDTARFRVTNNSSEPFVPATHRLGAQSPRDNTLWTLNRAPAPSIIQPGQTLDFVGPAFAATALGVQPFQWQMVKEGVAWFGSPASPRTIEVVAPPTPPPPPPPSRKDPNDLSSAMVINTGAFAADGGNRVFRWTNDSGSTIYVVKARLWLGVSAGRRCDAHADLRRETDSALLAVLQADHYIDGPAGAAHETYDYAPDYFAFGPGEVLNLTCFANGFGVAPPFQGHFTVTIWWRRTPFAPR